MYFCGLMFWFFSYVQMKIPFFCGIEKSRKEKLDQLVYLKLKSHPPEKSTFSKRNEY